MMVYVLNLLFTSISDGLGPARFKTATVATLALVIKSLSSTFVLDLKIVELLLVVSLGFFVFEEGVYYALWSHLLC